MSNKLTSREQHDSSWATAQQYVRLLTEPSSLFTVPIRKIKSLATSGGSDTLNDTAWKELFNIQPNILKSSPTLRTIFYFAAESIYPKQLSEIQDLTPRTLVRLFSASELAGLIGLTYMARVMQKKCNAEEWPKILERVSSHMEISAIVGETINKIGFGNGLLVGGITMFAHGIFALKDHKEYGKFRRKLKTDGKITDIELENQTWGCNHLQIATRLMQSLGYGLLPGLGFGTLASNKSTLPSELSQSEQEEIKCWQAAILWADCFHAKCQQPSETGLEDEFYLPDDQMAVLKERIGKIRENGSSFTWLEKTKKDVPENIREKLNISTKNYSKKSSDEG